jgi:hypothetical protein
MNFVSTIVFQTHYYYFHYANDRKNYSLFFLLLITLTSSSSSSSDVDELCKADRDRGIVDDSFGGLTGLGS